MNAPLVARPEVSEYAPYYGRYLENVPDGDLFEVLVTQPDETAADEADADGPGADGDDADGGDADAPGAGGLEGAVADELRTEAETLRARRRRGRRTQARAAERLGIPRQSLQKMMKRLGL